MGLLFKPRRKTPSAAAVGRSEEASVKDLSDLLGSAYYASDVHSLPASNTLRHASTSVALVNERFDELVAGLRAVHDSNRGCAAPCSCEGCSPNSVSVRADRLKAVKVLEYHSTEPSTVECESADVKRTAADEAMMAVVICLSSCVCAHLIFDALIGLEGFRWAVGLSKTLKICFILYLVIRVHPVLLWLGAELIRIGRGPMRAWAERRAERQALASREPLSAPVSKPVIAAKSMSASHPVRSWAAPALVEALTTRDVTTQPGGGQTAAASDCGGALQSSFGEECGSWDLEVPLEGRADAARLFCQIQGKVRLTEII